MQRHGKEGEEPLAEGDVASAGAGAGEDTSTRGAGTTTTCRSATSAAGATDDDDGDDDEGRLLLRCRAPAVPHADPVYAAMGVVIKPAGPPGSAGVSTATLRDALAPRVCLSELGLTHLPSRFAATARVAAARPIPSPNPRGSPAGASGGAAPSRWTCVVELRLDGNALEALPGGFGEALPALQVLALDGNRLTHVPPLPCPKLRSLALHDNVPLISVASLAGLTSLADVRLDRCAALPVLPVLPQSLEAIHLDGCSSLAAVDCLTALVALSRLRDAMLPLFVAEGDGDRGDASGAVSGGALSSDREAGVCHFAGDAADVARQLHNALSVARSGAEIDDDTTER